MSNKEGGTEREKNAHLSRRGERERKRRRRSRSRTSVELIFRVLTSVSR